MDIKNILDLQTIAGCCPEIQRAGEGIVRDVSYPIRDMDILSTKIREEAASIIEKNPENSDS